MVMRLKEHTIVTTRDFLRNFSSIKNNPTSKRYTVVSHGKPALLVMPIPEKMNNTDDWWSALNPENYPEAEPKPERSKHHLTLPELRKKYSFSSGEKHLSQRIDEIVYGIGR